MGLSFHDEESLVEAVGSLRFAADDRTSILGTESIDQDERLQIGHDDSTSIINVTGERDEVTMSRG